MEATYVARRSRGGFTLVEMLAVVVIIGILAGLITAAAVRARNRARLARMKTEIGSLDEALSAYRERMNDFPPDFSDQNAVLRHLGRAFPYYVADWNTFRTDVSNASGGWMNVDNMDESAALAFWLGGIPDGAAPTGPNAVPPLAGFAADPRQPFAPRSAVAARIGPFFDFDRERLWEDTGRLWYFPPGVPAGSGSPYLYFRARAQGYAGRGWQPPPPSTSGLVLPFVDSRLAAPNNWVNPSKYQILCAGPDGDYGVTTDSNSPEWPVGRNYDLETQLDNITNFTRGVTLKDDMP